MNNDDNLTLAIEIVAMLVGVTMIVSILDIITLTKTVILLAGLIFISTGVGSNVSRRAARDIRKQLKQ